MFLLLYPFLNRINLWLRRNIAYQNASRELSYLTDRELADMGLNRYDIHDVVCESVRQRIPSQSF